MAADLLDERRCKALSKRSGQQCKRFPVPGGSVCYIHGGGAPAVRAAAARRKAEAEARALLELVWDPNAAPVTNAVDALQRLAGRLQHAADVLGARIEGEGLDGATAVAWRSVLRELRQALVNMEGLDIQGRFVQLEQARAQVVTGAFIAALDALSLVPDHRSLAVEVFLRELEPVAPRPVVAGEVEP